MSTDVLNFGRRATDTMEGDTDSSLSVLAYRMKVMEGSLDGLGLKLDAVIGSYPTNATLQLILDPIREDLNDLKIKREEEVREKAKAAQQVKLLAYGAFIGPIATFLMTIILTNVIGGN